MAKKILNKFLVFYSMQQRVNTKCFSSKSSKANSTPNEALTGEGQGHTCLTCGVSPRQASLLLQPMLLMQKKK